MLGFHMLRLYTIIISYRSAVDGWASEILQHRKDGCWKSLAGSNHLHLSTTVSNWCFGFRNHPQHVNSDATFATDISPTDFPLVSSVLSLKSSLNGGFRNWGDPQNGSQNILVEISMGTSQSKIRMMMTGGTPRMKHLQMVGESTK